MRFFGTLLFTILYLTTFSQKQEVVRHIALMQFDSAWNSCQQLSDTKERSVLMDLTMIIKHGGQQKGDSVLVADIFPSTSDAHEQLLLGNYYLYNGKRGEALTYLLRSLESFKSRDDELLTLNYLSILHLYSRILLSDQYKIYLKEFEELAKSTPYLKAWHFNYKLNYLGKILNTSEVAEEYHTTYDAARRFFNRHEFNSSILAHFLEKEAIYFRWEEEYENSSNSFEKTVQYCSNHDFLRFLKFTALVELAGMQMKTGKVQEAKRNIDRARNQWDYSDPVLSELNFNLVLALNYYEQQGQWDSAYFLIKEIFGQRLQIFFENNNVRVSELQEEFNDERKDTQIENQNQQISSQRDYLSVMISFLFLLLALSAMLVVSVRKIRSKNKRIETLLRELHHRVKNNLQIVSSLLGLQSMKLKDAKAKKAVIEGKGRIRAMSLIHQKLYQNEDVTTLRVKEYLTNLVNEIASAYGQIDGSIISVRVPMEDLDTDTTLPIGLIVNELVSNSFKYAYQEVETPMLSLDLMPLGDSNPSHLELSIADNGPGLPENFNLEHVESFGLKLVNLLVSQIKGKITVTSNQEGCTFRIQFPNVSKLSPKREQVAQ